MAFIVPFIPAIIGGVGALQQGAASEAAGKYNAELGRQNAKVARQSAIDQAKQQARENYLRIGDMRASIGASGGTGGSFLDVLGDAAAQMELQRQSIIYGGSIKANLLSHGASLAEAEASAGMTHGYLQAAASLLGGNYGRLSSQGSNTTVSGSGILQGRSGDVGTELGHR